MTSVAQTPTPTTREEMVSYFNSQDRSQFIRLTRTIEGLLEFELNNWEPIHTSRYSWKDETKEPPVDGPKLLDLLRQTFTWKENICVWTDVSFEGDQRVAVRCKDRSDFLQKMSSDDISMSIGFGCPGDEEDGSEETYVDPLELDLCVSRTRTYAPNVGVGVCATEVIRYRGYGVYDEDLHSRSPFPQRGLWTVRGRPGFISRQKCLGSDEG